MRLLPGSSTSFSNSMTPARWIKEKISYSMRMLRRNACGVRNGGRNAARQPRHILRMIEGGLATMTIPAAAPPTISNSAG